MFSQRTEREMFSIEKRQTPPSMLLLWGSRLFPVVLRMGEVWFFTLSHLVLFILLRVGFLSENHAAVESFISAATHSINFVTVMLSFYLVIFNNSCYDRYATFYSACIKMQGSIQEIFQMTSVHLAQRPNERWDAVRYLVSSALLLLMRVNDKPGKPQAVKTREWLRLTLSEADWQGVQNKEHGGTTTTVTLHQPPLLSAEERTQLQAFPGNSTLILQSWALGAMWEGYNASGIPAPIYAHAVKSVLNLRRSCAQVTNMLALPIPFPYYHLLLLLTYLCYAFYAVSFLGMNSWLSPLAYFLLTVFMTGLRVLSGKLAHPFHDSTNGDARGLHLPIEKFIRDIRASVSTFAAPTSDLPLPAIAASYPHLGSKQHVSAQSPVRRRHGQPQCQRPTLFVRDSGQSPEPRQKSTVLSRQKSKELWARAGCKVEFIAITQARRHSLRRTSVSLIGLPQDQSLSISLAQGSPSDTSCLERTRDSVLLFFSGPLVRDVCLGLALIVCCAVVLFGLIISWTVLGLYLSVDNGWNTITETCRLQAEMNGESLAAQAVPQTSDGTYVAEFCNNNQRWFNLCIKAFVILFSYINFLPIAWRLSCLHHMFCSRRSCEDGRDFYGRPTEALWFHIPKRQRRKIAVLLNAAWLFHFASLAAHIVYSGYIEGQTWPGSFAQNLPFGVSIASQVWAGVVQGKEETKLRKKFPDKFPPKLSTFLLEAYKLWRRKEVVGSFFSILRGEYLEYKQEAKLRPHAANPLTGIDLARPHLSKRIKRSPLTVDDMQRDQGKSLPRQRSGPQRYKPRAHCYPIADVDEGGVQAKASVRAARPELSAC